MEDTKGDLIYQIDGSLNSMYDNYRLFLVYYVPGKFPLSELAFSLVGIGMLLGSYIFYKR